MVQDPNFWRRFSVAVHNDEAAAPENGTGTKETKHAYVVSLSSPPDSPASTPTSHCHLSPALPAAAFTRPLSAPAPAFAAEKQSAAHRSRAKSTYNDAMPHGKPVLLALHTLTSTPAPIRASLPSTPRSAHFAPPPQTPTPPRPSRRTSRIRAALSSPPPSPLLSPPPSTPAGCRSASRCPGARAAASASGPRLVLTARAGRAGSRARRARRGSARGCAGRFGACLCCWLLARWWRYWFCRGGGLFD
ncbi:hypothetical protein EJ07DRAFT_151581 [Lizonia empirigonia]|nr:hypothetical protein EJ07DRAFT_151581 [Lizonia empirigonia]